MQFQNELDLKLHEAVLLVDTCYAEWIKFISKKPESVTSNKNGMAYLTFVTEAQSIKYKFMDSLVQLEKLILKQ
jgi:hypothetical protein